MRDFNIATTATYAYFPFLLSFLGSLHYQYKSGFPGKIIVGVDNLPFNLEKSLLHYKNVNLETISQDIEPFSGVHGQAWMKAVSSKLSMVSEIIRKDRTPLLLIDSDILFTQSVHELFDTNFDVVVTYISEAGERHVRRDGLTIDYIGSAAFFNHPEKSLLFIDEWMRLMGKLKGTTYPPYETPALNLLLKSEFLKNQSISVGVMQDRVIACDQALKDDTRAIHLKSWGPSKDNPILNYRVRCARSDFSKVSFPPAHNDQLLYEEWIKSTLYPGENKLDAIRCAAAKRRDFEHAAAVGTSRVAKLPKRVIYADGGLSNRLGSILFPLSMSSIAQLKPTIWWPKTNWCDCNFFDIFEADLEVCDINFNAASMNLKLDPNLSSAVVLSHISTPLDQLIRRLNQEEINDKAQFKELWSAHPGAIIYNHNNFPDYWYAEIDYNELLHALTLITPKKELREISQGFIRQHNINRDTLGLHVRGTDFRPSEELVSQLQNLVTNDASRQIFLCTDDPRLQERFSVYSNVVTRSNIRLVDYNESNRSVYRSKESVMEAIIDLLILSECSIIKTSSSSFLNFATILSGVKKEVEVNPWL